MSPTITFRLRGVDLREDEHVAAVGSSSTLGSWNPRATCSLESAGTGYYQLSVTVEDSVVEYKYVILRGNQIRWEGGANRVVHLLGEDMEYDDTWVSSGASEFITREQQIEDIVEAAADTGVDESAPGADDEATEHEVDESAHVENVPPEIDGAKKRDADSRKDFASPAQRSPFLLIDGIFRMCRRGTANAH